MVLLLLQLVVEGGEIARLAIGLLSRDVSSCARDSSLARKLVKSTSTAVVVVGLGRVRTMLAISRDALV